MYFFFYHDKERMTRKIRVATDCSGIEAPIQALLSLGIPFDHIWSSDIDPMVRKSIEGNYHPQTLYTDIFQRNHKKLPRVDLYIAGFPCQTFSFLGKREGFFDEDKKGIVFFECYQTIQQCKPKVFLLENVKGLVHHDGGKTLDTILSFLRQLPGYQIDYQVLNTCHYGIPQHRERVYIVGIRSSSKKKFHFPTPIPLKKSIHPFLEKKKNMDPKLSVLTPHKIQLLQDLVRHGKIDSLDEPWLVNLNVSDYKRTGARKGVCPCLLAGEGGNCVYYMTSLGRRLSPREYLRLQGFPDSFQICVPPRFIYKQAGNSMSVNVLIFLFREIMSTVFHIP